MTDEKAQKKKWTLKGELEERRRARRSKRAIKQRRPQKARCPVPDCAQLVSTPMCAPHWRLVSVDVRRKLLAEVKALRFHGGRRPTENILELYHQAIREVLIAQHKQGASRAQEGEARILTRHPAALGVLQQLPPAQPPGGAAPAPEGRDGQRVALPTRAETEKFGSR